jgi:glycosyltransferase involved in cell wall biosynthesis
MEQRHEVISAEVTPRLSVVIACLNVQDVFGFQLSALARQQCDVPWELLICDRGSVDDTVELADSWVGRLPLRILRVPGSGDARSARHHGVRAARGEWIGFCDPHDEVGDGWLSALCAGLGEHPFVVGRFETEWVQPARAGSTGRLGPEFGRQHVREGGRPQDPDAANLGIRRAVLLAMPGGDLSAPMLQVTGRCDQVARRDGSPVFTPDLVVHRRRRAGLRAIWLDGGPRAVVRAVLEARHAEGRQRLSRPARIQGSGDTSASPAAEPASFRTGPASTREAGPARSASPAAVGLGHHVTPYPLAGSPAAERLRQHLRRARLRGVG